MTNPAYELHDVMALRLAVNEDDELDRHLEIGMLNVKYVTIYLQMYAPNVFL